MLELKGAHCVPDRVRVDRDGVLLRSSDEVAEGLRRGRRAAAAMARSLAARAARTARLPATSTSTFACPRKITGLNNKDREHHGSVRVTCAETCPWFAAASSATTSNWYVVPDARFVITARVVGADTDCANTNGPPPVESNTW